MIARTGRKRCAALAVTAMLTAGCKSPRPQPDDTPPDQTVAQPHAKPVASVGAGRRAPMATPIPAQARQLIIGIFDDWTSTTTEVARWQRRSDAEPWQAVGSSWPAVIGNGAAWGRGLHGDGPPGGQLGPNKHEGDGKSPAGIFQLRAAYGYARKAPAGTRWPYLPVDLNWNCIDDSRSSFYGTIVNAGHVRKDWISAESMRRPDALYTWVIDVAHNPEHEANAGSCIFLHVWRDAASPTVGCTAMAQSDLETILTWIDPEASPTFVLLPRPAYVALGASWGLPAR